MGYSIRYATDDDIADLVGKCRYLYKVNLGVEIGDDEMRDEILLYMDFGAVILAVKDDGEVVGGIGALINRGVAIAQAIWIFGDNRRGVGLKMIREFERWGFDNNASHISIEIKANDERAIELLKCLGYVTNGIVMRKYHG